MPAIRKSTKAASREDRGEFPAGTKLWLPGRSVDDAHTAKLNRCLEESPWKKSGVAENRIRKVLEFILVK